MSAVRKLGKAARRFAIARMTDHLFTLCSVKITKLHIYGGLAGAVSLMDFADGHIFYSCGVWGMALMDMSKDIRGGE